jgi:glyoxylase-like metal-dependent hydrolase (beta-lactamase superfamily II)
MSSTNRRSFLARGAALATVPAVAALAGGALTGQASADTLPSYAPIPQSALGPAVNAQGYYAGRVEKNLYWVTDGTYQAAFLTTSEGVVLFDAPPTIGHNLQRAIDQVASANGVSSKVTHIVYSHHHADHLGGSSLFGNDVVRIGQIQTKQLLASEKDPHPAAARRHLRHQLRAARGRGARQPGVARHQPHARQQLHSLPRP